MRHWISGVLTGLALLLAACGAANSYRADGVNVNGRYVQTDVTVSLNGANIFVQISGGFSREGELRGSTIYADNAAIGSFNGYQLVLTDGSSTYTAYVSHN